MASGQIITETVTEVPRIVTSTIEGKYVSKLVLLELSQRFKFNPLEEIEYLYVYMNDHDSTKIDEHIYVGITNYRVFKSDKGEQSQVMRSDIVSVKHIDGGFFHWDKICCYVKGGQETFGIYESATCKFFCNYLTRTPFDDPVTKLEKKLNDAKKMNN